MGKHEPLMKIGKNETSPLLNEKKSDGFYGGTSKSDGDDKRCRSSTVPHQWRPAILTSSEALKNEKIGSSSANLGQFDELDERSSSIAGTPSGTSVESSPVSTSSENETSDSGPHVPYTRSQWAVLLVLYFATLTSSFAVCLFPPFFPQIAESKGAPASVYGFIIGTNCLTSFIVTPIIGKHLNKIGLRFAFVSGLFISGGCCFLSGFLEFFPNGLNFVLQAIAIRVVHATGNAFVIVSTFAYIALEFPHSVARIFSMTRAMMNVAQLLGPVVGGALYEVGGFKMPFIIMGMVQMSMALPSHYLLPEYDEDEEENKKKQPTGIFRILAIPTIWIALSNIIFSTMSNGFLSITLEPQVLRQFNLSPFYVGLVFGLKDGANAAFSPLWGYLSDRDPRHNKGFIFLTAALGAFSFVLLGPFPGLPIKETLTIAIIALTLNGIAISGQQVAGMVDALNEAINAGYPDSPDTHGVVSGVWSSLSGGGRFISRCFAGILVDAIGFRDASTIIVFLQASIAIVALGFFLTSTSMRCRLKPRKRKFISVGKGQAHMCTTATPSEPVMSKSLSVRTTGAHRRRAFSKSFDYTSSFEA